MINIFMSFISPHIAKIAKNRFWIYAIFGVALVFFGLGFSLGWKIQKGFQSTQSLKAVEKNLTIKEKQDEIDSIPYDRQLIIDVLRESKL